MLGNPFAGALMRKRAQQAEEESEQDSGIYSKRRHWNRNRKRGWQDSASLILLCVPFLVMR